MKTHYEHSKNYARIVSYGGRQMKVKIVAKAEDKQKILDKLQQDSLVESNDDFEFVIIDPTYQKNEVLGKTEQDEFVLIKPSEIIYIESYGHDIICHSTKGNASIKEKLYEMEGLFEKNGLYRVHRSFVINKHHIKTIKPTLNTKFILTMSNNDQIEVSRTYYYIFKNIIGL